MGKDKFLSGGSTESGSSVSVSSRNSEETFAKRRKSEEKGTGLELKSGASKKPTLSLDQIADLPIDRIKDGAYSTGSRKSGSTVNSPIFPISDVSSTIRSISSGSDSQISESDFTVKSAKASSVTTVDEFSEAIKTSIKPNGSISETDREKLGEMVTSIDMKAKSQKNSATPLHAMVVCIDANRNSGKPDKQTTEFLEDMLVFLADRAAKEGVLDKADNKGKSAMHSAASYNVPTAVHSLAKAGANVNAKDLDGNTPLHEAALSKGSNKAAFIALLQEGADHSILSKDRTRASQGATFDTSKWGHALHKLVIDFGGKVDRNNQR